MAQVPNSIRLLELPTTDETKRVQQSMYAMGFIYEREDKETCYITIGDEKMEEVVNRLAQFIEPRFALRERFFPDNLK